MLPNLIPHIVIIERSWEIFNFLLLFCVCLCKMLLLSVVLTLDKETKAVEWELEVVRCREGVSGILKLKSVFCTVVRMWNILLIRSTLFHRLIAVTAQEMSSLDTGYKTYEISAACWKFSFLNTIIV